MKEPEHYRLNQVGYVPNAPDKEEHTGHERKKPASSDRSKDCPNDRPNDRSTESPTEATEADAAQTRKGTSVWQRVNKKRLALLVVCAGVFVYAAGSLAAYGLQALRSRQTSDALRELRAESSAEQTSAVTSELTPEPSPEPTATSEPLPTAASITAAAVSAPMATDAAYPNNPNLEIRESLRGPRKQNHDIVGWITVNGVLDEAVVQRDNRFYLTHDSLGFENATGALFLDERCLLATAPQNLIIHGHNMKTGQMFGILKKYKVNGAAFLKENPYIKLETLYDEAEYVIFAVLEVDTRYDQPTFLDFCQPTFDTSWMFDQFITRVRGFSMYAVDIDVTFDDELLTLATCTGIDENQRLLVMARRVRSDEDELALKKAILSVRAK